MGKNDANECIENLLSNCRVQLALSTKKDGMILEHTSYRRNRVAENSPFSAESNK